MFHKFSAKPTKTNNRAKTSINALHGNRSNNIGNADSNSGSGDTVFPLTKRRKVAKACERCRLCRKKCDEQKPCAQCVSIEAECIVTHDPIHPSQENNTENNSTTDHTKCDSLSVSLPSPVNMGPEGSPVTRTPKDEARRIYLNHAAHFQGFFNSGQSAFTFNSAASSCLFPQLPHPVVPSEKPALTSDTLLKTQRSYYIRLFWESCHPLLQFMSEERMDEAEALTAPTVSDQYSTKGALVDSMIALGMQHSHATGLSGRILGLQQSASRQQYHQRNPSKTTWPGFEYFYRSREHMRANTEMTLDALRCHTLLVLYFMRGNAFRDAYNLIGITVRKAYIARLHRTPPSHLPENEKTARMQLWWMLFLWTFSARCSLTCPLLFRRTL